MCTYLPIAVAARMTFRRRTTLLEPGSSSRNRKDGATICSGRH